MRLRVHAVGRMKAGPGRELSDLYFERFAKAAPPLGLDFQGLSEIAESRARTPQLRRSEEGERIAGAIGDAVLLVLDEIGRNLTSEQLAGRLSGWRDEGARDLAIVIGGPDGHDPAFRDRADLALSFGALTWPHQLVRAMLAEQLYRSATILSGHPYHRA